MPTTTGKATEFITFSRASLATVTDADGKIKWAPHNLLSASEQFDASAWSKGANVTITANAGVAPDGTSTADRAATTGAAGNVNQNISLIAGATYKISMWVKSYGGTSQTFRLYGDSTLVSSDFTATSSWQRFEYDFTATTTGGRNCGFLQNLAGGNYDVLLWGASLTRSDLGGMQANTSAYPLYNPTTAKNLLGFSEDFSNGSVWLNLNLSVTANSILAPNGLQTADAIFETATTGRHRFRQALSAAPASSTVSVYAKANGRDFISINIDDGNTQYAVFNLATGAVGVTGGGAVAHTPVSVGNGWWRCAVTFTSLSTNGPYIHLLSANDFPVDYAGDVTKGVYLWGAQLSDSASLDPYVASPFAAPVAGAYHGPRRDFDAVSLACRGLLVEEQRANLSWHSADFTQSYWTKVNSSIDATAVVAPDGVSRTTLRVKDDATNASHAIRRSFSTTNGLTYTLSFWVKKGTTDTFAAVVYADGVYFATLSVSSIDNNTQSVTGATGVNPTASRVSYPSGWYRYSFTFTATSASAPDINFHPRNLTGAYVGAGDYTDFYGIQLEQGSFATSYIPTGASSVTRSADVASVATSAFPYSSSEGTLVFNGSTLTSSTARAVQLDSGDTNRMQIAFDGANMNYAVVVGGSAVAALSATKTASLKAAAAYKENDFAVSFNGGAALTDTSGAVPSVTTLSLGKSGSNTEQLNGHIRQITYIPRRLSNADLQARTV